jgi:hypothetical protein
MVLPGSSRPDRTAEAACTAPVPAPNGGRYSNVATSNAERASVSRNLWPRELTSRSTSVLSLLQGGCAICCDWFSAERCGDVVPVLTDAVLTPYTASPRSW